MIKRNHINNKFYIVGIALIIIVFNCLTVRAQELLPGNDRVISTFSFSNDPFADTQWYIDNPGYYANPSNEIKEEKVAVKGMDMDVVKAWKSMAATGGSDREVVVAVIDTGVDYTNPDLVDHMWINQGEIDGDGKDNDHNGYVDDIYGWDFYNNDATVCHYSYSERLKKNLASPNDNDNHGTHVAGIIAATANNNLGIAGIASNINVKIMSLKINGGKEDNGSIESAIEAVKYATMMGADICNLSWGTHEYSEELKEAMKESGMLFVAAAGNTGDNNDKKAIYPASFDLENLISVTFINADGRMTGYSNYGKNSVDLAAPGEDIYSTIVGGYDIMSGSSMAAPQVTAIAAMLYSYHDHLYAENVKDIITGNIKKLDFLDGLMAYGGIPDAYLAVKAAGLLKTDEEVPVMSFETIFDKGVMVVPVHAKDTGNSKLRVVKWIYGNKKRGDFGHGTIGTTVENSRITLSRAGTYTFYASDYAGNEITKTYYVAEDTTAPKLSSEFTVAENYKSRTVTVSAADTQSGVKRIEYLPGIKSTEDFLPADAGTKISLKDDVGRFKVTKDGVYTIFATDNRGNCITRQVVVKTVKSEEFSFMQKSKTINPGDHYVLVTLISPSNTTDRIVYTSTNRKIALVSSGGRVMALAEGKAYIKGTTASGIASICLITVAPKK